jgi:hypothetical protein
MPRSLDFLLGLLDRSDPVFAAAEDFDGEHGPALRLWQRLGFLAREGEPHPVPSCPHCREGVPYLIAGEYRCGTCYSDVGPRHLLRWRFDLDSFLAWLAGRLRLAGGVRCLADGRLWQLGGFTRGGLLVECFFRRGGGIPEHGRTRLLAYRSALLLSALPRDDATEGFRGYSLSLLELLREDRRSLRVADLVPLLCGGRAVRFDPASGSIWAGSECLGDVPFASKGYHLLARLADEQDRFVSYADLKDAVLRATGSSDGTDEATFCHKLKRRIKAQVPAIDRLIATTNKAHGYRLRKHAHW